MKPTDDIDDSIARRKAVFVSSPSAAQSQPDIDQIIARNSVMQNDNIVYLTCFINYEDSRRYHFTHNCKRYYFDAYDWMDCGELYDYDTDEELDMPPLYALAMWHNLFAAVERVQERQAAKLEQALALRRKVFSNVIRKR